MKTKRIWTRFSKVAIGQTCWIMNTNRQRLPYVKAGERSVTRVIIREDGKKVKRTYNLCDWSRTDDDVQVVAG